MYLSSQINAVILRKDKPVKAINIKRKCLAGVCEDQGGGWDYSRRKLEEEGPEGTSKRICL